MFVICCHRFLELKLLAKYTIFSASWILRHLPLGTVEHVERRRNNYCSAIFDQETHHTCSYQTNNWLNFSVYGFAWESGNPVQRLRSMRQIQHNILRLYWGRPQLYFFLSIIQFGSTYHGQRKFFLKKMTFWMKQTRMAKICVAGAGSFVPKLGPFWNGCGSIFPTPHSRFSIYLYARWIWLTICIHPWYLRLEQQLQSLHSWIVGSGKFVAAVRSGQIGKDRPLPNWVHSRISVTFEGA